jgi:Ca-activated chloride channel family protein
MTKTSAVLLVAIFLAACGGDDDGAYPGNHKGSADAGAPPPYYSDGSAAADAGVAPEEPPAEEEYGKWIENDFVDTQKEPLSTFSIDVDTASYTIMRQNVTKGILPDPNGVRVEEYVNYFKYIYPQPTDAPFSINMDAAPSKFGPGYHMMRIGLQGKEIAKSERKPANLVFLVDVSGSMQASNKLGLVKKALNFLVEQLEDKDTLGIVTYSSQVKELLQPTEITDNKAAIVSAINSLYASGGTAGGPGIQTAYAMAKNGFIEGGINRVILCTDGDFNIGLAGSALVTLVEEKRDEGITLSVLGFGMGNYKDNFLEDLSNKGNGNYAYIDNQQEAEKVFGEKLLGTLQVIAKDVKIQVEFDPKTVTKYRLVGYENRLLKPQDFTDDTKDAGEIGAAHAVTALYELEMVPGLTPTAGLATVRFRYKDPDGTVSKELTRVIQSKEVATTFEAAGPDFRFAAAVVEFAEILRHSKHSDGADFDTVKAIASAASGDDTDRLELVKLVETAKGLWTAGK